MTVFFLGSLMESLRCGMETKWFLPCAKIQPGTFAPRDLKTAGAMDKPTPALAPTLTNQSSPRPTSLRASNRRVSELIPPTWGRRVTTVRGNVCQVRFARSFVEGQPIYPATKPCF